jgi:hypothetical protein
MNGFFYHNAELIATGRTRGTSYRMINAIRRAYRVSFCDKTAVISIVVKGGSEEICDLTERVPSFADRIMYDD